MLLELQHIYKDYIQETLVVPALKDVNLSVDAGEYVAIMGPSGSGKTTLMNIIGCLDRPTKGEYLLEGESIISYNENKLSDLRLSTLGFVFQTFNLLARQTALDNVSLPLSYAGIPVRKRKEIAFQVLKWEHDVLLHRHMRIQRIILKHHPDSPVFRRQIRHIVLSEENPSLSRFFQPADQVQHGAFPAAGWAKKCNKLPVRDLKIEIIDGNHVGTALDAALEAFCKIFQYYFHFVPPSRFPVFQTLNIYKKFVLIIS